MKPVNLASKFGIMTFKLNLSDRDLSRQLRMVNSNGLGSLLEYNIGDLLYRKFKKGIQWIYIDYQIREDIKCLNQ